MSKKIIVYCYETGEKFYSISEAANFIGTTTIKISSVLDKPNRTCKGYHWCTSLDQLPQCLLNCGRGKKTKIICYETKKIFNSIKEAKNFFNISDHIIKSIINNQNKAINGYHLCTDLSVFEGLKLESIVNDSCKYVYCYETKEKFSSFSKAARSINLKSCVSISNVLDNPSKVAGGYHWCTSLDVFDGVELKYPTNHLPVKVYCYETKQEFNSLSEAAKFLGLKSICSLSSSLNEPNKTSKGYHWCTDLSLFDGKDLTNFLIDLKSSYEFEIIDSLKSYYDGKILQSDRSLISPYELDIYLPDCNIAIEFNGDYWHSEKILSRKNKNFKNFHQIKTLSCLEKGVSLLSIFEFQYTQNKKFYLDIIRDRVLGIDRPDVELLDNNTHNLQFCNKKYFKGLYDIIPASIFNNKKYKIFDCGQIKLKGN